MATAPIVDKQASRSAPSGLSLGDDEQEHRSRRLLLDGSSSVRRLARTRRWLLSWTNRSSGVTPAASLRPQAIPDIASCVGLAAFVRITSGLDERSTSRRCEYRSPSGKPRERHAPVPIGGEATTKRDLPTGRAAAHAMACQGPLPCMECDSDETSRCASTRQRLSDGRPGLQRSAHDGVAAPTHRRSCCGALRNEAPSIVATLLETLHGAG